MLDICGGIATTAVAMVQAGWNLESYWLVENGELQRKVAKRQLEWLEEAYPGSVPGGCSQRALQELPGDVTALTREMVAQLGRVDVVVCAWPCQGLSRASRGAKGLDDARSGLFRKCHEVLGWIRERNPQVRYLFENVVFKEREEKRFQQDWREVCQKLGEPLVFDAARVSPAHNGRQNHQHALGRH